MAEDDARLLIPSRIDPMLFARRMPAGQMLDIGGPTMGTTWSARLIAPQDFDPAPIVDAIERMLGDIIAEMSGWEPASVLSLFNAAPEGRWFTFPPMLFEVVKRAVAIARDSGGAFDPTAGAVVERWGFGPVAVDTVPTAGELAALIAHAGWHRLEIDPADRRVRQPGGLRLDLSGIAKGYAVDRIAATIAASGVANALVEIGGEFRGIGLKPDGQPWWVEIEQHPDMLSKSLCVALSGLCIATSGDYRRFHQFGGNRLAHCIDPRTGFPVDNGVASVTVIGPDCMDADAHATVINVLGETAGIAYADARGIAARILVRSAEGPRESFSVAALAMLAA